VLVVDEDPIFTATAAICLEAAGFETRVAGDGAAAMTLPEREPCEVMLIDLLAPGIDGLRLIGLVRKTPQLKRLAILVILLRRAMTAFERALALGAKAFAAKPVSWSLLPVHVPYAHRTIAA
jgi:CheY-like chemotaxis protein